MRNDDTPHVLWGVAIEVPGVQGHRGIAMQLIDKTLAGAIDQAKELAVRVVDLNDATSIACDRMGVLFEDDTDAKAANWCMSTAKMGYRAFAPSLVPEA